MKMEEFLPSEVARAVYGYLISEGCEEAAKVFLETSPNLGECKQLVQKGKTLSHANTSLLGRTLTEVLSIGCTVHSLVRQANEKRSKNQSENLDEGWTGLFDQLRSFILAETVGNLSKSGNNSNTNLELNFNFPRSLSALRSEGEDSAEPPTPDVNSQELNTPKRPSLQKTTPSQTIADDYRNLVEECQEGLDLSLSSSPQKSVPRSLESALNQPAVPFSTSGAPGFGGDLDFSNQSAAISAITQPSQFGQSPSTETNTPCHGFTTIPQVPISSQSLPVNPCSTLGVFTSVASGTAESNRCFSENVYNALANESTAQVMPPFSNMPPINPSCSNFPQIASSYPVTSTISSLSQPITTSAPFPGNHLGMDGISRLPDPPIILLDNQNQPMMQFGANDPSFYNIGPCAASTPHPIRAVPHPPEDTAIIIYPPIEPQYTSNVKTKKRALRSSKRLRTLLPKPPRPPLKVVHVNVLPQTEDRLEEEDEDTPSEGVEESNNENDLAQELPDLKEDPNNVNTEILTETDSTKSLNLTKPLSQRSCSCSNKPSDNKKTTSPKKAEENDDDSNKDKEIKTPKPPTLRKNISRSTPRRDSHVRALSFNTPNKPPRNRKANTSPKMAKSVFSPRTSKLNNVKRSALFKSPTSPKNRKELSRLTEENESEEDGEDTPKSSPLKVPIATRSPAPKLSSVWKEVTDVTITAKPQWDEKIRSFMTGNFVDPAPPPKSKSSEKNIDSPSKTTNETKGRPLRRSARTQKEVDASVTSSKSKIKSSKSKQTPEKIINDTTVSEKSPTKQCSKKINPRKSAKKKQMVNKQKLLANKKVITPKCILSDDSTSSDRCFDADPTTEKIKSVDEAVVNNFLGTSKAIEPTITQENTTRNILLDDLVVSSNSNFPAADGTINNVNEAPKITKSLELEIVSVSETSDDAKKRSLEDTNLDKFELIEESNLKEVTSPKFALPTIPVQETPLKEFHKIVPLTPVLNTPFLKTIRRETSVLEEDLLLTPSLPPTPQVDSPCHPHKTPCKPSPHHSSSQKGAQNTHNLPQIVTKSTSSPVAVAIENRDIASPKRNITPTENKTSNQPSVLAESNKESLNTPEGVLPSPRLSTSYQQQISSSSKEDLTSSFSDSSEEELHNVWPGLPKVNIPPIKTRILQGGEVLQKSEVPTRKKNYIYTSTDTSESESDADNSNISMNKPKPDHKSRLTTILLERERQRLEKLSKKEPGQKKKPSTKKLSKTENRSNKSITENKNVKKIPFEKTGLENQKNKSESKGNFPRICLKKNSSSKPITPEKKQLQNELLKQTRKEIYGESFYPTSESESDDAVFEKKKVVIKCQVVAKAVPKKSISKENDFSSEADSPNQLNKVLDQSVKCVRVQSPDKFIIPKKSLSVVKAQDNKNSPKTCQGNVTKFNKQIRKSVETISSTVPSPKYSRIQCSQTVLFEEENANKDISSAQQLFMEQNLSLEKTKSDDRIGTEDVSSTVDENISEIFLDKRNSSVESEISFKSSESTSCKPSSSVSNKKKRSQETVEYTDTVVIQEKSVSKVESSNESFKELLRPTTPPSKVIPNSCNQVGKENKITNHTKTSTNSVTVMYSESRLHPKISNFNTSKLDLDYKYQFDAEGKLVTLSVSENIVHLLLPSSLGRELDCSFNVQGSSRENQANLASKNLAPAKGKNGKRRIKLIPVQEDKYEQKLQIDYDVVDGKVISQRGRKISGDSEFLEISCSTIDADSVSETITRSSTKSARKVDFRSELKSVLRPNKDIIQQKGNTTLNEADITSRIVHTEDKCDYKNSKNLHDLQSKKYCKERLPCSIEKKSSEKSQIDSDEVYCRRVNIKDKEKHSTLKYENKMLGSESRKGRARGDRYQSRTTCVRSVQHRYTGDRGREEDRRRYSERRRHSPPARHIKGEQRQRYNYSDRDVKRNYTSEKDYSRRNSGFDSEEDAYRRRNIPERRKQYTDVDNVDERDDRQTVKSSETFSDPRSEHAVTYSEVELETSNEAPSLMDFAVLKQSNKKRVSFAGLPKSESSGSEGFHQPSTAKRKAPSEGDSQAAKKLKMEEVDMEKAKHVIERKTIGALLDKLHPDTSNEATGS